MGFSPFYNSPLAYQFQLDKFNEGEFVYSSDLRVNGNIVDSLEVSNTPILKYEKTTIRIQTLPVRDPSNKFGGQLRLILDVFDPDTGKFDTPVFDYTTDRTTFIPPAITYAVFGGENVLEAIYNISDGNKRKSYKTIS